MTALARFGRPARLLGVGGLLLAAATLFGGAALAEDSSVSLYIFEYNRVFIKEQKTRWGSCSGQNNINLNVNLVRLPQELIDYTLLHELVHTRIKNHSPRFWSQLDDLLGDAKRLDKKLSKYQVLLI